MTRSFGGFVEAGQGGLRLGAAIWNRQTGGHDLFKDILVPLLAGDIHQTALAAACTLATQDGSHVVALVGVSVVTPSATAWAYYPAGVYGTLNEVAQAAPVYWCRCSAE